MAVALLASPRHGKHQAAPLSRFGREMGLGDRAGPPRRPPHPSESETGRPGMEMTRLSSRPRSEPTRPELYWVAVHRVFAHSKMPVIVACWLLLDTTLIIS